MDCVYICRSGENEELRYSIRSVVQNLTHDKIWLVGYKPKWYIGNYIEVENKSTKFENINECLSAITDVGAISDDFILMNDDFYIVKPMGKINTYHGGVLSDKISRYVAKYGSTRYSRLLSAADEKLRSMGIEQPLDYDIHTPMVMNKNKLKEIINIGLAPRSAYGNVFNIGGTQIDDVKIYKHNNSIDGSYGFVSSDDTSFKLIKDMLEKNFTTESKYEQRP